MGVESICGCNHAVRAIEVAAFGGHTVTFIGSPESQAEKLAYELNYTARFAQKQVGIPDAERTCGYAWSPCPCGNYGDPAFECTCTPELIAEYCAADPMPLTDMYIRVPRPRYDVVMRWARAGFKYGETTDDLLKRMERAWEEGGPVEGVDESAWALLRAAVRQLHMQPKTVKRTVGVAKTIATLAGARKIEAAHMAEAIQYRPRP